MIVDVSCERGNDGLASVLWPAAITYRDEFPLIPDRGRNHVFVTEQPVPRYLSDLDGARVRAKGGFRIDTRKGFVEVAIKRGLDISDTKLEALMRLSTDEEFFKWAKRLLICPGAKLPEVPKHSSFLLFCKLFSGIHISYPIYVGCGKSRSTVFNTLTTMMIRAMNPNVPNISEVYKSALINNATHLERYKKCALSYAESGRSETDFLDFLSSLG